MVRTRVGYAGGTTNDPTYYNIGDHTETVEIDYDPDVVSYQELLDVFWNSHEPAMPAWSRQYQAIVFYHNDEQKRLAVESRDRIELAIKKSVYTEVKSYSGFYLAEDYHQKYYLQNMAEFDREYKAIYPSIGDFINSTAAARVNGYIGGYGSYEVLEKELGSLGISESGQKRLLEIGQDLRTEGSACPVTE